MVNVNLFKHENGQIRMLEAFLAVLLVSSALIISAGLATSKNMKKDSDLYSLGIQALLQIDQNGRLGELIDERNWTVLAENLRNVLPVSVAFNLTVCNKNGQMINGATISNGILDIDETVSVEYVCVSQNMECHFYMVCLQLSY
ncbi:MAG: hypothetical protein QXP20_06220 [Candidatus Bathyarchaeia archaeon]